MKDWYLITPETRPNITGGFENDSFVDFREDALFEALDTDIASTITIYDSHMHRIKEIRAIIQNNLANTMLNSTGREIIVPIGTLKGGMYLKFENAYWIVVGYPGNNKVYEKAVIEMCQDKIKWQKSDGTVVERWANFATASKYDVGIYRNNHITIASNNFNILIPEDDDCATLDDKRIFIDRDKVNPKKVFHITRSDDVLHLYGEHGGVLSFIADRTELNRNTDRPDLGLCDYIQKETTTPLPPLEPQSVSISGAENIKLGYKTTYSVKGLKDSNFKWNIVSKFNVENTSLNNDITLRISDYKNIGSSFLLQIIVNDIVVSEKKITVTTAF